MERGRITDNCKRAEGRVQTSGVYFKGGGAFREEQWLRRGKEEQEEYLVFSPALWHVGCGRKKSHYLEELQRKQHPWGRAKCQWELWTVSVKSQPQVQHVKQRLFHCHCHKNSIVTLTSNELVFFSYFERQHYKIFHLYLPSCCNWAKKSARYVSDINSGPVKREFKLNHWKKKKNCQNLS